MIDINNNKIANTGINLNEYYGPYTSTEEAHNTLLENGGLNQVGFTVGVIVNNEITEYWYQGGTTKQHLVKKQPTEITVDNELNEESENPVQNKVIKNALDTKAPSTGILKTALAESVQTSLGKADSALQPAQTATGLLKDDGSVDTETQGKAANAIQMPAGATADKVLGYNNGAVAWVDKPSNGQDGADGADGEDGKSAYILWCEENGYDPEDPDTPSKATWLASLKANIGAFKFVANVPAVESAFEDTTTGGIGTPYSSAIDGITADANTLSIILLMNTATATPAKTYMIATQDDGNSGYQFVYAGDLQSAMPSNVLTEDDVDDEPTSGSDTPVKSGGVSLEILRNFHDVSKNITTTMNYQNIFEIPLIAGRTYKFRVERDISDTEVRYFYIKANGFVKGVYNSGEIRVNLPIYANESFKEVIYRPEITEVGHLTCSTASVTFTFNCKIYTDETDLNESIIDNIKGYVNEQEVDIKGLDGLKTYHGWVNSNNNLVSTYPNARYAVIPVKSGDVVTKTETSDGYFVIVKEFTYNPTLPYNFVYADGESGRRNAVTNLTMPSDAKYIILMVTKSGGTSNIPSSMTINGVDIAKSLEERLNAQVNAVSGRVTAVENFDAGLDDDIIDNNFEGTRIKEESMIDYFEDGHEVYSPYRGVTVECNSDGTFVFDNTTSGASGGLLGALSNKFTLEAGTYKVINIAEGNVPEFIGVYVYGQTSSIKSFDNDPQIDTLTINETTENVIVNCPVLPNTTYNGTWTFKVIKVTDYSVNRTAYDGKARNALFSAGLLDNFIVKDDVARVINIPDITPPAGQGMCVIREDLVYGGIFTNSSSQQESRIYFNNTWKWAGIAAHCNDLDYCEYTDTLITATITDDVSSLGLYLLQGAYNKLYVDSGNLAENDWTFVSLGNDWSTYDIVGNCFGESCDIVYCFVKAPGGATVEDYLLKVRLEMSDGAYTGNCTIVWSKKWGNAVEIQGSKFCNGKLYVSIDKGVSSSVLYAGIAVIDVATMKTIQYPMYANYAERSQQVEGEGLAFIGDKGYHIVMNHTNSNTLYIREFERFGL